MRKKLLALVMCATMVLGTAVTAVAAPLQADYDNAKKVFSNGSKVMNEITANDSYKLVPVTVNVDLEGGVKYGFDAAGKAVRLDADGKKPLKYVGKVDIDNTKKTKTVVNASVVATTAVADAVAKYGADAVIDGKKAAYVADISAIATPKYEVAVVTFGGTTAAPTTSVEYFTMKNTDKVSAGVLSEDANYVTKDYYSYDVDTTVTLLKADLQTSSEVGSYVYTADKTGTPGDFDLRTVAYALEAETITKDAIALVFDVQQIVKNTAADKDAHPYVLNQVTAPVANVTLTMENDWFSNTALKAKTLKAFRVSDTASSDNKYDLLALTQSGLDLSTPYGKFDVTFSVIEGQSMIIFDVDADAAKDNAGQADSDKTSSPKTGDVAPIAALAVVMMGAFGAMVVASKKRA